MKQGGSPKSEAGFTIVETLIVLAVTGVLLASAIVLINGRQNKTQFQTAINGFQQQLQQIINETSSGYFPNNGTFSCTADATTGVSLHAGTSAAQGSNGGCAFMGKAIQFGPSGDNGTMITYSIVGWSGATGQANNAKPVLVTPMAGHSDWPSNAVSTKFENGLNTRLVYYDDDPTVAAKHINGFAFVTTLGQIDGSDPSNLNLASGTTHLTLVPVGDGTANVDSPGFAGAFYTSGGVGPSISDINICMASGTTNQSGLFTIDAQSLTVTLQVRDGTSC